jgi:two-component system, chemotaxis family, protein-glutamate methylesterase/glutaminase
MRVLVVDDSAVVRQTLTMILGQEGFEVTTAADPIIALDRLRNFTPDVILLDLEMPRMDGLSFLKTLMAERPLPVVICSAVAARGTEQALRALEHGAVDIVAKPQLGVREFLYESAVMLGDTIRAAGAARLRLRDTGTAAPSPLPRKAPAGQPSDLVVAIGASTGGPDALRAILGKLDASTPGLVIVQHMPRHFTAAFARSLDRETLLHVTEAATGDAITAGCALVAPGDAHVTVVRKRERFVVRVEDGPLVSRHRPSVDVLFRSVAEAAGSASVGVILTGMGEDGADGLCAMRRSGAMTIAQDEATSVVFGMPREAIARGGVERVLPLHEISQALMTCRKVKSHVLQK